MRVLVTRPAEDAARTAERLRQHGHEAIIAPVVEIRARAADIPDRPYQAVLATSANAMRALAQHPRIEALRRRLLIAVGDASAQAARAAGFAQVISAGGAAQDLVGLVRQRFDPAAGPVLYPSGAEVASDLEKVLSGTGYDVTRAVVYEAEPVAALPTAAARAVRQEKLDAVLVYSPRSARILAALAERAGVGAELAAVAWLCLSPAVAEAARSSGARRIAVAERPDEEALLHALSAPGLATAPPKRV